MDLIACQGLGKSYGELVAVAALDLTVEEGEIFGFLGPNGAGKTTAISMIAGVATPSRGQVRVGGHDVWKVPAAAKRLLGLVPQELALYEDLTATANLRFFGSLWGLKGAERDAAVAWALGVAGLEDRAQEPVSRFSGGMKRRLNLAAGLLHRPRLLILDEPTVGVDPQSRAHIFDAVRALNAEHGMTVLYTSHYMEEVQSLCPRIGIMDGGRLVALDHLDALIAAHAPGAVEIAADGDQDAVREALAVIAPVTVDGRRMRVEVRDRVGDVVRAVEGTGARLQDIKILQADLETVFLSLTGHALRDDA